MSTKREHSQDAVDTASKKRRIAADDALGSKITNLMHAVNEVLNHGASDDNDDIKEYMGEEAYGHLSELQLALDWQAAADGMLSIYRANVSKLPKSIPAFTVSAWKASEIPVKFPALPQILDITLETAVFTHQGITAGRAGDLSYERLEWVGDSYLELTCTLLIAQTFPAFSPGKTSQLRERCVKNLTLAAYARYYGFDQRARIPQEYLDSKHPTKDQDMTKIMGDIFEAYVAAVVLSDPENGVARVTEWLKQLWALELKKDIVEGERNPKFDSPMWNLRGAVDNVEIRSSTTVELGPKDQLQKLLGSKGIRLAYREAAPTKKDRSNKLPLFTIGVYLDGYGKKELQLGYGKGNGKKDAGQRAAQMALDNKKLMKELTDKKKLHDAQIEREREALEST
ncbi:Ribonuclease III [Hyphodiscus hymeniophilus]|uniref:Ribonuclease III n=1 Tax=Hyphodiscus hymeniophilus TaxID=353542 RepID=A0A9P7AVT4_9HELO|nr:Ribonuclease III [Hyphodiscus hymeniophilus]